MVILTEGIVHSIQFYCPYTVGSSLNSYWENCRVVTVYGLVMVQNVVLSK